MSIGILGGGIGGLSTAIALKQKGFDVDVYERHIRPTDISYVTDEYFFSSCRRDIFE